VSSRAPIRASGNFAEQGRVGRGLVAQLGDVAGVVQAEAEDLARPGHQRGQVGLGQGSPGAAGAGAGGHRGQVGVGGQHGADVGRRQLDHLVPVDQPGPGPVLRAQRHQAHPVPSLQLRAARLAAVAETWST
jgi:hypothetical protein